MDARRIAFVQQSFEKVEDYVEDLADLFYAELFAIDPS